MGLLVSTELARAINLPGNYGKHPFKNHQVIELITGQSILSYQIWLTYVFNIHW